MNPEFDDCVYEIVEYENDRVGGKYNPSSLSQIAKPGFKSRVKDSAEVFKIKELAGDKNFIITLSNQSFPDSVSDAVERANAILTMLGPELGRHILSPTITGKCNRRSYAFWPMQIPISENKFKRKAQLVSVNSRVIQWISDVGRLTRVVIDSNEELESRYYEPLTHLLDEDGIPSIVKQATEDTLLSLESTDFRPVCVAQHGDFWHGNILLERCWPLSLRSPSSFYVIDWGGSNALGYSFIDLLRYMMSVTSRDNIMLRYLVRYQRECALPIQDIVRYACAHAGYLGMNRGEFPLDRYHAAVGALIQKASDLLSRSLGK